MREIKFRIWDEDKNIMVYPGELLKDMSSKDRKASPLLNLHGELLVAYPEGLGLGGVERFSLVWARIGYNLEIMQYSGLKDKNGKEIYRGDKLSAELEMKSNLNGDILLIGYCEEGVVIFEEGAFYIYFESIKEKHLLSYFNKHTQVNGNIYENPELMND